MRFIAEAASTEVDLNFTRFDPSAIYQLAEDVQGKEIPIIKDFDTNDRVGFVRKAYVKNNRLVIEGEIKCGSEGYVVPGFIVRSAEQENLGGQYGTIWVDTDVELVSFGLTNKPCDPTLKPLKKMEVKLCVAPERSSDAS